MSGPRNILDFRRPRGPLEVIIQDDAWRTHLAPDATIVRHYDPEIEAIVRYYLCRLERASKGKPLMSQSARRIRAKLVHLRNKIFGTQYLKITLDSIEVIYTLNVRLSQVVVLSIYFPVDPPNGGGHRSAPEFNGYHAEPVEDARGALRPMRAGGARFAAFIGGRLHALARAANIFSFAALTATYSAAGLAAAVVVGVALLLAYCVNGGGSKTEIEASRGSVHFLSLHHVGYGLRMNSEFAALRYFDTNDTYIVRPLDQLRLPDSGHAERTFYVDATNPPAQAFVRADRIADVLDPTTSWTARYGTLGILRNSDSLFVRALERTSAMTLDNPPFAVGLNYNIDWSSAPTAGAIRWTRLNANGSEWLGVGDDYDWSPSLSYYGDPAITWLHGTKSISHAQRQPELLAAFEAATANPGTGNGTPVAPREEYSLDRNSNASRLVRRPVAPTSSLATRTWVSGVGDDINPCSRTAPCKTFAGAISRTAAGGEIDVLDPGGYGGVTLYKSITIDGGGNRVAGVLFVSRAGIIAVPAGPASVTLRNLEIKGTGFATVAQARNLSAMAAVRLEADNAHCSTSDTAQEVGIYGAIALGATSCNSFGTSADYPSGAILSNYIPAAPTRELHAPDPVDSNAAIVSWDRTEFISGRLWVIGRSTGTTTSGPSADAVTDDHRGAL